MTQHAENNMTDLRVRVRVFAQVGDVRNCCLKTLAPLHETQDLSLKLELFTNRFKVSEGAEGGEGGSVHVG